MSYAGSYLVGIFTVIPLVASMAVASNVSAQVAGQTAAAQGSANIGTREVLLGTSTTPRSPANPTAEREAQDYYDTAERELKLGRPAVAQRHLEQLVARYPNSPIANVARHDLIGLYGNRRDAPQRHAELSTPIAAPAIDLGPKNHLGVPPPSADVPFAQGSAAGLAPANKPAEGVKRPTRTVQDTFRQSAGDLVFFGDGSTELGARARRVLEAQAEWLKAQPTARVIIEGHADDTGNPAENFKLSEARAKAVHSRLIEAGIEPARLSIAAVGKSSRVANCDDSACAAQNRRVATVIVAQSVAQAGPAARTASNTGRLPWDSAPMPSPR